MNIAILTQPIKANYGGVLQNFALQTVLRKLGHNPITIDYRDSSPLWFYVLQTIKTCFFFFIPSCRRKFTSYRNVEKRDDKMGHLQSSVGSYPKIVHSLNMKKGRSDTPLS